MKTSFLPRARTKGLVIEELKEEVLIYDLARSRAHCLNPTAAVVWKHCNGRKTAAQIAGLLRETDLPVSGNNTFTEQVVWLALEQLSRDHLLEERSSWPAHIPRVSRREAMRRIGIGAAIAMPIVASITAPQAAQAGSCRARNASCSTGAECCSGACSNGHCL